MAIQFLDAPELLTRVQAAEYLQVAVQTLAVWATTKRYRLPYIKIGSGVRYRREDLEKFLAENTVGGAAE